MDLFFSKKNNFIFVVLVIYLIPIIVGPPAFDPEYDPKKKFTLRIHHDCFDNIHDIFKEVPLPPHRVLKKEYFQYAILYLRDVTEEEKDAYNRNLGPGEDSVNQFLLYEGKHGTIYNEEFAYKYFHYIKYKFQLTNVTYHPKVFCKNNYPGSEMYCIYALECFGFVLGSMNEIVEFAHSHIVLYDIEHLNYVRRTKDITPIPYYAKEYLKTLSNLINTKRMKIMWPEDFCRKTYTKERTVVDIQSLLWPK